MKNKIQHPLAFAGAILLAAFALPLAAQADTYVFDESVADWFSGDRPWTSVIVQPTAYPDLFQQFSLTNCVTAGRFEGGAVYIPSPVNMDGYAGAQWSAGGSEVITEASFYIWGLIGTDALAPKATLYVTYGSDPTQVLADSYELPTKWGPPGGGESITLSFLPSENVTSLCFYLNDLRVEYVNGVYLWADDVCEARISSASITTQAIPEPAAALWAVGLALPVLCGLMRRARTRRA